MIVIADSSPLLYLSRLRLLEVLSATFGPVVVPRVVWNELVLARPDAPGVEALLDATWITVDDRALPSEDVGLDPGETAAILLVEALAADLLLIDERAGRAVAKHRGIAVRGTLGVLVQAREAGTLSLLRPVLDALAEQGFRLSPVLVREALRRVGED